MTPIDAWVRQKLDDANNAKEGNSSPLFSFLLGSVQFSLWLLSSTHLLHF